MNAFASLLTGLAILSLAAGCTDSAAQECKDAARPFRLTIASVPRELKTLAVRSGMGPWETVAARTSKVETCVAAEYVVASSCGDDAIAMQSFGTIEESDVVELIPCSVDEQLLHLTGTMSQPGFVSTTSESAFSNMSAWNFDVTVLPGENVVVATDSFYELDGSRTNRGLLRRFDTRNTSSVDFDLADGVQLSEVPLVANGTLPGEQVMSTTQLHVADGRSVRISWNTGTTTYAFASADVSDSETQTFGLTAIESGDPFYYYRTVTSSESTFELMPRWSGIVLAPGAPASATWPELPAGADEISLMEFVGSSFVRWAHASHGALEAMGTNELSFDITMPGLSAAQSVAAVPTLTATAGDTLHRRLSSISKSLP